MSYSRTASAATHIRRNSRVSADELAKDMKFDKDTGASYLKAKIGESKNTKLEVVRSEEELIECGKTAQLNSLCRMRNLVFKLVDNGDGTTKWEDVGIHDSHIDVIYTTTSLGLSRSVVSDKTSVVLTDIEEVISDITSSVIQNLFKG